MQEPLSDLVSKIVFLGFVALFIAGCSANRVEVKKIENAEVRPSLEAFDFSTKMIDVQGKSFLFNTPHIEQYASVEKPYWECKKGGEFFRYSPPSDTLQSFIRTNYAKYQETEEKWHLKGEIFAFNKDGDTITTEELFVDEKADKVWTERQTIIQKKGGNITIARDGFTSNTAFEDYELYGVSGEEIVEEEFDE